MEEPYETINPNDYITLSYYDKSGKITELEYPLTDESGNDVINLKYDQLSRLYLKVSDMDFNGRIPTMIVVNTKGKSTGNYFSLIE